ncbi:hypothetical protein SESBI_18227 [Sesbania bispinosa]|nr:hypothetical protein SESBI_18227 [Sesbania bispinosa]
MNHSMILAMFNHFVHLKLLAVGETRFASIIIMLIRMRTIKHGLQSMVISEQWSHYREDNVEKAASAKEIILNDCWWDQVDHVLNFTSPIYDMLLSCDTDEPSLHLIWEKWDSIIEKVKLAIYQHGGKELNEHSSFYEVDRMEVTQEFVKFSSDVEELGQFDSLQDRWNLKPKECYKEEESKLWDFAADEWDPSEGVGVLEVASLSLDGPNSKDVLFTYDGDGNDEFDTVRV